MLYWSQSQKQYVNYKNLNLQFDYTGDFMVEIGEVLALLEELSEDRRVPRNVRASLNGIIGELNKKDISDAVKLNTAISLLDEVSNDPNILPYTRIQIWNVVSLIEGIQAEEKE